MIRVLLAEDHQMVRQATRLFLESAGVQVVGEAVNGREAVQLARELVPDVVVMDIHMPELTGIEATRRIRHEQDAVRVLVLSAYDDAPYVRALLDAGADGFVLKTDGLQDLLRAIQEVAVGKQAFDRAMIDRAQNDARLPVEPLTERELEVLRYVVRGHTNKQIGDVLFISARTVQGHLQNIFQKLGVASRTEAASLALKQGIVPADDEETPLR